MVQPSSGSLTVCSACWYSHDPLALVGVPRRVAVHVRRDDGPPRLLELQEEHVVRTGALAQRDVGPEPDRADPDDLVRDVDQPVAAEDDGPLRPHGLQVLVEGDGDALVLLRVRPGDQRRLLHEAQPAVVLLR